MANEISITLRVAASKNGVSVDSGSLYTQQDMTGSAMAKLTQDVATAAAQLNIGPDITTIGALLVKHTGIDGAAVATTKYVQLSYSADGSSPFAYVTTSTPYFGKPTSATIYAKAESGATSGVKVDVTAIEA
jgi:hypothetical protein